MSSPQRRLVRYTVNAGHAEENEALVRAVFRELEQTQPDGLRYATFKLDDGLTFVHVASIKVTDGHSPLAATAAFGEFRAGLHDRCAQGPELRDIEVVGSYGWLGDGAG